MYGQEDCQDCLKAKGCVTPCLYVELVSKLAKDHKSIRERLAPPDISEINNLEYIPGQGSPENRGYKDILNDRKQTKANNRHVTIKEVRDIKDTLQRAVAAMLYADLTLKEISIIIDKSERTVRRICKG